MDGQGPQITSKKIDSWDPAEYHRKRVPMATYARRAFDRVFYRNLLFFLSLQWIRYNRSSQQWRPISMPDWFPKQVTNKYAVAIDIMKSVFMQSDPQSVYTPASEEFEDIAAARSAMDVSKCIELEVEQSLLESKVASWVALTGNAFIIDGYDNDAKHGTNFIPDQACLNCMQHVPAEMADNGCPYCSNPNLIPAHDGDGQPMGQDVPIGRMYSEVASPFELHFDMAAETIEKSPFLYRTRTYPIDVLKEMFPEHADKIKPDDSGVDSGQFYQMAMAYITNGTTSSPGNFAGSVGSADSQPRGTLSHLWVPPSKELPNGGEALLCSNTTLWKGELSFHNEKGNPIIPVTHFGFNTVPGRVFYKTPADDLIFKQVQRNKMEAFVQLAMERTSNPGWLLPKGIGIDNISGEPGEKIWYNGMGGLKPERVAGSELPGAVFRWMASIDTDMQDLSHTRDIMRGEAPKGVPTLGGAQLLLERGLAGYADGLKSWGRGWNQVRRNRLLIWKEFASDERTLMVLGQNKEWEARKFSKDAIKGRINVYLEEASIAPKSKAYDQLIVSEMIDKQMVDMQDPAIRVKVMHIFDKPELIEGLDIDIKDAIKEKEEFVRTGQVRPRQGVDNDAIHSMEHGKFAKSDEFWKLPPPMQQAWIQHKLWHDQNIQKQQQQQQAMDPRAMNAKARLEEIEMEVDAFGKEKQIDLQHRAVKQSIDLHAHGMKKGIDAAINLHKTSNNGTNGTVNA